MQWANGWRLEVRIANYAFVVSMFVCLATAVLEYATTQKVWMDVSTSLVFVTMILSVTLSVLSSRAISRKRAIIDFFEPSLNSE